MNNRAFTLIELLVVIAIIGILSGIVIVSLNSAREKGKIASIKSTLKNLQTQAQLYHLENGTFAGLCNYVNPPASQTYHASIQPFIDSLTTLVGANNVRCVVRTSSVPSGSHFFVADSLENKNFGIAVLYNNLIFAVDTTGVIMLDQNDSHIDRQTWNNSNNICANNGKRLPSAEIFKATYDIVYHDVVAHGFTASSHGWWSSTRSDTSSSAYYQNFNSGGIMGRVGLSALGYVRCGS